MEMADLGTAPGHLTQGAGTLAAAAESVTRARVDVERLSATLEDHLASLHGRWSGRGGAAFVALQRAWTDRHRVVLTALDRFDAALRTTEREVAAADEEQSSAYAALAARLG